VDDNKIRIEITGTNTGERERSWDLWFNTRLDGFDRTYVPVSDTSRLTLSKYYRDDKKMISMPHLIIGSHFTFLPRPVHHKKFVNVSKAFIFPDHGYIAGFSGDQMILIRFENHSRKEIHPHQATVEIYNAIYANSNLLELEYHAPYKTLQPGEKMRAWETWEIFEYKGKNTPDAHIEFINKIMEQ